MECLAIHISFSALSLHQIQHQWSVAFLLFPKKKKQELHKISRQNSDCFWWMLLRYGTKHAHKTVLPDLPDLGKIYKIFSMAAWA